MYRHQIRSARAILEWSQEELARRSGVSLPTIKRIEPGMSAIQAREETLKKIKLAFEAEGILFVDGPHVGALLGVVTAVPGIVQGRRCVLIKTSPLEPAIAILPADAIKDAKKARKEGDKRWADILESAAHMAENLPPEAGS